MATVMVIDDERAVGSELTAWLEAAGHEAIFFDDAELALGAVLRHPPDLILLDNDMPRFAGIDFHECLRVTRRGRNLPVVYLVSGDGRYPRRDALRLGARGFLRKPCEREATLRVVQQVLLEQEARHGREKLAKMAGAG